MSVLTVCLSHARVVRVDERLLSANASRWQLILLETTVKIFDVDTHAAICFDHLLRHDYNDLGLQIVRRIILKQTVLDLETYDQGIWHLNVRHTGLE